MERKSCKANIDYKAASNQWQDGNTSGHKPTINDVAGLAGVSKKTVSRVINESPLVYRGTREGIKAIIKGIGDQPDPQARGLHFGALFWSDSSTTIPVRNT